MTLAGAPERVPADRYVDGVDQTSFLLAPDGRSCRKYHYYWLVDTFSALRVGEYKWMLSSTSDDDTDVHGAGRLHRRHPALHLPAPLQPVPRPQGEPELPHAQARLPRGAARGHARPPRHLPGLSAEARDGPRRRPRPAGVAARSAESASRRLLPSRAVTDRARAGRRRARRPRPLRRRGRRARCGACRRRRTAAPRAPTARGTATPG